MVCDGLHLSISLINRDRREERTGIESLRCMFLSHHRSD
jgi:hypothetical protein